MKKNQNNRVTDFAAQRKRIRLFFCAMHDEKMDEM